MGFVRDLTGRTAADAAREAGDVQANYGREASALLDPFKGIGEQGLEQASFLTDPQAQFDYLRSNPLFRLGLQNANDQTMQSAAARGRLSSGDTLQQLSNNALLVGAPLIQQQKGSIGDLLNYGLNTAGAQGNLLTGQGAALAGGLIGQANARGQGSQNVLDLGMRAGTALFSDPKLKENIKKVGNQNGFNIYEWTWNKAANAFGLVGDSIGVMADEVLDKMPDAVVRDKSGYLKVNYAKIGVQV